MSDDAIRFFIEQKVSIGNTAANVCVLWWVSSIVFCTSVFGAVWMKQDKLRGLKIGIPLGLILLIFFTSIIVYGVLIYNYLNTVRWEIGKLAADLGMENHLDTEATVFQQAMAVGTSSFVLVWFCWVTMWFYVWCPAPIKKLKSISGRRKRKSPKTDGRK